LSYGSRTFTHDENGNLTKKADTGQEINYIYDVEDRLVRVENGSSSVIAEYYYDPFGRRLWKEVDGIRKYFVYSDEGLVGEYDGAGNELRTYGWAPNSPWGTDPLFVKTGGTYYWYQNDHQGTPQKLIATSGLVVWAATYDSFGNAEIGIEGVTNNLRFPGQYFDAETGLHYNWHRYYDPATGRYLRTDPIGDGLNLYAYVFNNPIGLIDPMGLCAVKKGWNWFSAVGNQYVIQPTIDFPFQIAYLFNNHVFYPLLDILALPDQLLDYVTSTSYEERIAWSTSTFGPTGPDDIFVAALGITGKLPKIARGFSAAKNSGKGLSVIGPRSTYRELAQEIGAKFLNVTDEAWTWEKNRRFLYNVVKRGDDVIFAGKFNPGKLDPDSVLAREIRYLTERGYKWTDDFSKLVKQ
jgi:RHS repeat-associated protein